MSGHGILRRSVLWHLLEEGTATNAELIDLIGGSSEKALSPCLAVLRVRNLVQVTQGMPERRRSVKGALPKLYGLTPAGIQEALQIDHADVRIANPNTQEAAP